MKARIASILVLLLFQQIGFSQESRLVEYSTLPGAERSKIYSLTVNGKDIFVEKFKDISYAHFAFSGKTALVVKPEGIYGKYTISPLSYNIVSQKNSNDISFSLDKPAKLILQLEGIEEKLFIFADAEELRPVKPGDKGVTNIIDYISDRKGTLLLTKSIQKAIDDVPDKGGGTIYFPNGKYLTGTFVMKKGVTLYLESGALIQGSQNLADYNDNGNNKTGVKLESRGALIYFQKADNARIMGRGTIAMSGTKIKTETGIKVRICNLVECNSAGIYDVILRDSGGFNIHILHSSNITMRGYKIINDLSLINQDGTDPDGCKGVVIDDVFMYTSDDAIAVKADFRLCENIIIKNCVLWTIKSALKIGSDPYFGAKNVVFQNNNVVHADRALALYAGRGKIENVKFIDNKSEFVGGNSKRQLIVFQISNDKENMSDINRRGIGEIKNVEVINYTAYQKSQNKSIVSGTVGNDGSIHKVSNVLFKNLVIEGKHCLTPEDAGMILSPVKLPKNPNSTDTITHQLIPKSLITVENIRFQ